MAFTAMTSGNMSSVTLVAYVKPAKQDSKQSGSWESNHLRKPWFNHRWPASKSNQ